MSLPQSPTSTWTTSFTKSGISTRYWSIFHSPYAVAHDHFLRTHPPNRSPSVTSAFHPFSSSAASPYVNDPPIRLVRILFLGSGSKYKKTFNLEFSLTIPHLLASISIMEVPQAAHTKVQPQAATEMNVLSAPPTHHTHEGCKHDSKTMRLRGGGAGKDCFLGLFGCFLCFECCEGCCDCIGDIICCPCEMCC